MREKSAAISSYTACTCSASNAAVVAAVIAACESDKSSRVIDSCWSPAANPLPTRAGAVSTPKHSKRSVLEFYAPSRCVEVSSARVCSSAESPRPTTTLTLASRTGLDWTGLDGDHGLKGTCYALL